MITPDQFQRIAALLPLLPQLAPPLQREFQQQAFYVRIPAGREVFALGDRVDAIALLLSGMVRVYKIGETGREITLYRFGSGQSCVLTANAILSQQSFQAIASVEHDAEAIMIDAQTFRSWVRRDALWLDFVLEMLSQRLANVLEVVDEVAFRRMDVRAAALLAARAGEQNPLTITHQEIADELGSSREVISRILENFTRQGWIRQARGVIEVLDAAALTTFDVR